MAKFREETIKLAEFADRDEHVGNIMQFDADEFITVVPYGTLPKDLVLEIVDAFRNLDTDESKHTPEAQEMRDKLRWKRNAMLIKKWKITDPLTGVTFDGAPKAEDFAKLAVDIEHALDRAAMSAFTRPKDRREEAGEG